MPVHTYNTFTASIQRIACRSVDPAQQRSQSFQNLFRFVKDEVLKYSPHYRRKFAELGIRLETISDKAKFARIIPFTEKDELRSHFPDFVLQPNWPGGEH